MIDNAISTVSSMNQKKLDDILSTIKSYEIEIATCENDSYNCTWTSNKFKFQVRIVEDLGKLSNEENDLELAVIVILLHSGDDELLLEQINLFDHEKGSLVIFDEKEDIQVFSKDIWNLLVSLKGNS